jgi:hypothetical protein
VPPTICRISLRYIQQMAGVPHQSVFQKIASEFSERHINGAQLRRYSTLYVGCKGKKIIEVAAFFIVMSILIILSNKKDKQSFKDSYKEIDKDFKREENGLGNIIGMPGFIGTMIVLIIFWSIWKIIFS